MATIEKRETDAGTTYRVKVRLKGHPTQSASFDRLTDAKKWATQTEAAIREGRYFTGNIVQAKTLAEAIERYKNEHLPELKDAENRWRILEYWLKNYGAYTLPHLTADLLAKARDELSNTPVKTRAKNPDPNAPIRLLSPARVNRYLTGLSPVLTACVKEWGWLEYNPMEKVRKRKEPAGIIRFLSTDERSRLMAALKDPSTPAYLYPVVLIAAFTGARKENILSLTWQQIDFDRRCIFLPETKNGERQTLPLVDPALSAVIDWKTKPQKFPSAFLFPSPVKANQHITLSGHVWKNLLAKAQIENFRFHDLRHSFASELAMSGASLAEIAAGTGHKTLQMVKRYAHLSHDHTASVIERMAAKVAAELNQQNSKGNE
jgi:integrase